MPKGCYVRTKEMKERRRKAFFENPNYKRFRNRKQKKEVPSSK